MSSHYLLQGIVPTQGLNSGLLHCRQILYCLSHQGSLWLCVCIYIYIYIYIYLYVYLIYVYMNHFAVHLKLTQHCKSTIIQLKKKFKNQRNQMESKFGLWNTLWRSSLRPRRFQGHHQQDSCVTAPYLVSPSRSPVTGSCPKRSCVHFCDKMSLHVWVHTH